MVPTIQSLQSRIEQLEILLESLKADLHVLQCERIHNNKSINISDLGYTQAEALELRTILSSMEEDWDDPEMDIMSNIIINYK